MHTRPLATWPNPTGAMLGKVGHFKHGPKEAGWERFAGEAARTVPGRENGGNCDIKNLSRGCSLYLPVFVPGANLSMGDMHFSQGDGEVSFCGAIEMSGAVDLELTAQPRLCTASLHAASCEQASSTSSSPSSRAG